MAKVQESFFLPAEVREALRPVVNRKGVKRKWMLYTAAIVSFLRHSEREQDKMLDEVNGADLRRDFSVLFPKELPPDAGDIGHSTPGKGGPKRPSR